MEDILCQEHPSREYVCIQIQFGTVNVLYHSPRAVAPTNTNCLTDVQTQRIAPPPPTQTQVFAGALWTGVVSPAWHSQDTRMSLSQLPALMSCTSLMKARCIMGAHGCMMEDGWVLRGA